MAESAAEEAPLLFNERKHFASQSARFFSVTHFTTLVLNDGGFILLNTPFERRRPDKGARCGRPLADLLVIDAAARVNNKSTNWRVSMKSVIQARIHPKDSASNSASHRAYSPLILHVTAAPRRAIVTLCCSFKRPNANQPALSVCTRPPCIT